MVRKVLAIVTGVVTGLIVILLLRTMSLAKYPFPEDLDWLDNIHRNQYIGSLPDAAFWIVIGSHLISAFIAGLLASLISRKDRFTVGVVAAFCLFTFVLVANFYHDYPGWYLMVDTLVTAVAGFSGAAFGRRRVV